MEESPIFAKTYEMLAWLFPVTARFPKSRRHSLTEKTENTALELFHCLVRANTVRGAERREALTAADAELQTLRVLLRLAKDLGDLSIRRYGHVSRLLAEIGKLLGGWLARSH